MDPLESFTLWKIPVILSGLACYFASFALVLLAGWMVYSGIKFLLSRGEPTAYGEAKKNFLWTLVGGLVIYGVYTIILSVTAFFGVTGLPWIPSSCT